MEFLCKSAPETVAAGVSFGKLLKAGDAVLFRKSDLGAGKTCFTKGIALSLGVKTEVTSPTFSIVNEYDCECGLTLFHFDLYRLSGSTDLDALGIDDYLRQCEKGGIAVFEWYENAKWLKNEFEKVYFAEIEITRNEYRKIMII